MSSLEFVRILGLVIGVLPFAVGGESHQAAFAQVPGTLAAVPNPQWMPSVRGVAKGLAQVSAWAQPPKTLTQIDPCLMYKCGGDAILLKASVPLFARPDRASRRLGTGNSGDRYMPDNEAVITLRPGIYEATAAFSSPRISHKLKKGDRIYVYHDWGEDCFTAWIAGKLYGYGEPKEPTEFVSGVGNGCVPLPEHTREVEKNKSEFWLRVPLQSGQKAWFRGDTLSFEWVEN